MPVASKLDSFAPPPLYPRDLGERLEMPPNPDGFFKPFATLAG
jgi:hypothetical protein